MRVLFVSSEIYPLVKTGGLADVSAALPKALTALGVEMQLLLPGYPKAIESAADKSVKVELADFMGAGPMRLISALTPDTALPLWLVDCPSLFRRSGGPYQDEDGQDWPDNAQRFAVFNHVAARLSLGLLAELAGRHCPCQRLACRPSAGDLGRNLRPKACDSVHDAQPRLSGFVSR
jgi:starch synthase